MRINTLEFRIDTILWYLKHPHYYLQLFRYLKFELLKNPRLEKTGELASTWCNDYAMNTDEAIYRLTGNCNVTSVRQKYADLFSLCDSIASACPARMGGPANIDLLYYLSEHLQATRIIETGVSYGWSSMAFLLSLKNRANAMLISTDMPYPDSYSEKYVGCIVPQELKSRWYIIDMPDREALPKAISMLGKTDLCHYDSNKTYYERKWAYTLLWNALREGGILISDDVSDNLGFHDFCQNIQEPPLIVKTPRRNPSLNKYVGIIIKSRNY